MINDYRAWKTGIVLLAFVSAAAFADVKPAPKNIASIAQATKARQAFERLIRAYENGDVAYVRSRLDPSMIGYQLFVDALVRDSVTMKQTRIQLYDTQILAGPDVAVVQTTWERRFFASTTMQPVLQTGRSMILLHHMKHSWTIAAIAGDNPFGSGPAGGSSGTLATVTFTPAVIPLASIGTAGTTNVPVQIEVVDPDLAGIPAVNVQISSGNGDLETFGLAAVSPGRFIRTSLPMRRSAAAAVIPPVPNDGVIEVSGPTSLTLRYVDTTPGGNRPPATLTATVSVQ